VTNDQIADLYHRIAKVTTRFTFVLPVSLDEVEHVANEVRRGLEGFNGVPLEVAWGFEAKTGYPFVGVRQPGHAALYYRPFLPVKR
jgi:hypothetical protein